MTSDSNAWWHSWPQKESFWGKQNPWKEDPWAKGHYQWHRQVSQPNFEAYAAWSTDSSVMDVYKRGLFDGGYDDYTDSVDSRLNQATSADEQIMYGMQLPEEPTEVLLVNSHSSGAYQSVCADARAADLVAFDAEWAPDSWGSDNPISVLQLAFPLSRRVYVIQLERLQRRLPKEVQMMLVNPEVRKVGFAVDGNDRAKMARSGIAVTNGSVKDVQAQCAAALGIGSGARSLSLKNAANSILGFKLEKDKRLSCSDWAVQELTPEQVRYAALDAWVTLRLSLLCN